MGFSGISPQALAGRITQTLRGLNVSSPAGKSYLLATRIPRSWPKQTEAATAKEGTGWLGHRKKKKKAAVNSVSFAFPSQVILD